MKAAPTFKFQTEIAVMGRRFVMIILAVFWIALLAAGSTAGIALGIKTWMVGACLFLVFIGQWQSRVIVSGARVLHLQRTPKHLWSAWLRSSMVGSLRTWGILVLAGTALLLTPQSPWKWSSAAALFSATLSLSTVAALSNAGIRHRAWAWTISVGGMMLVLFAAMTIGLAVGLNRLAQAPFILHALMVISWPLLAYSLLRTWQRNPPVSMAIPGGKSIGLGARISNYARRYTPLLAGNHSRGRDDTFQKSPVLGLYQSLNLGLILPLTGLPFLATPWRSDIHPYHLVGWGFYGVYCGFSLVCKDLHWRQWLAPGGMHRGQLGWPIFRTTIALQTTWVLLVAGIWIIVAWAAFDVPLARTMETAWAYRVYPIEWLFMTSVMLNLRAASTGSAWSAFVVFGTYFVALLVLGGILFWTFGLSKGPTLFQVDGNFVTGLCLATAALVLLSNRLWTVKKLQPFLRLN